MAKVGDTVRYLNSVGGGIITRIEGQIAYIDDEGFETPVLLKEIVVVMPAGQHPGQSGFHPMFDQNAFDEGRRGEAIPKGKNTESESCDGLEPLPELPVEETSHGDRMNIALAFEPGDVKHLDNSTFAAVLVNDSNYFLSFSFLRRGDGESGWSLVYAGTVAPNEYCDLATLSHAELSKYERITFQCTAFKKDKLFTLQTPVSISRKLDLTKFHKYHCFRPGIYFETPVIEISLVKDGVVPRPIEVDVSGIEAALAGGSVMHDAGKELSGKYRIENSHKGKGRNAGDNPFKVLPLIEVDLHIGELTDSLVGMEPKDMLEMQLAEVRKHMKSNSRRIGQKLVFIHGKGEGVLRKAVLDLIRKEYPKAELQDASFREYGFGATLVTIH